MEIIKIIGVAILTTFAVVMLRGQRPEIAAIVGVAGGLVVLFMFIDQLALVFDSFYSIVNKANISSQLFSVILKIIGVGYITEFACGVCADSGMQSLADKVALAGKVTILVLALPIINSIIDLVVGILP
ncbi:MAG: stage III sporulation AC/AD family protein [Firmicutes bacterium]|nr:stage III sporulation AC/AD family protein [Bacillota bacterium]